jgi:putative aldouronate transport system substrate-binding protein
MSSRTWHEEGEEEPVSEREPGGVEVDLNWAAGLNRRGFLRASASSGLLVGAAALLSACGLNTNVPGGGGAAAPTAAPAGAAAKPAGAKLQLPTYQPPANAPAPDYPGSADGAVMPGYLNFPKTPFQSVKQAPGDGSEVSIFLNISGGPPPPMDQNPPWQAWNKALNATLNFQFYPFADLAPRFATLIAGNDLPDIISTLVRQDIPLTPELFNAKAQDLTPFVSGDAIKDYPNLAALPTRAWKGMVFDGKIWGVPTPTAQGQFFWWPLIHQELVDAAGTTQPKTTDDYKKLVVELTKPQQNQYGVVSQGGYQYSWDMNTGNGFYPSMFGAPNLWAVDSSGKFTHTWETDGYKQALAYTTDLFKAGIFHPNSPNLNVVTAGQAFEARQGAIVVTGLNPAFWDIRGTAAEGLQPPANVNLLTPPAAPGAKPQYYNGRAAFGMAFLKKAPEARIKMLLRVLDYIAAPFGSQEYLLIEYGVQGRDWDPDANNNPILNKTGQADFAAASVGAGSFLDPRSALVGRYLVLYSAADPTFAKRIQDYQKILAPISTEDASLGLYSATQASSGVQLIQPFGDGITDIVAGRRPLSDLDGLVSTWRSSGGDKIRQEYQASYAASQ